MGNSKQARYNRIGSSGHNPNNYIHLDMMNAPASTIARTFRSGFSFNSGRFASMQNGHRFMFKTLTPEIRRQLYETGGKTRKSMEPPPPALESYIKFLYAYDPSNALTTFNDLSINDLYFWDASAAAFDFSYSDTTSVTRVLTIVEGTPYHANASSESDLIRDFCGNALDSSFIAPDQPLAFRLKFDPTTFQNPNKFHFVPVPPEPDNPNQALVPETYDISAVVHFADNTSFDLSYELLNVKRGETQNQLVDISLGSTFLNSEPLLTKLRNGNFKIETHVSQRNKYTGKFEIDKDTKAKNIVDFPNNVTNGIFVYTPPFLITDFSLVDLSNDRNERINIADDFSKTGIPRNITLAGSKYLANHRYPDLSGLLFVDNSYSVNRITVTYNRGFPSNVLNDWIHKIEYNQRDQLLSSGWKDVLIVM